MLVLLALLALPASCVGIRKAIAVAVPKMLPIFDFKYHGRQTVMMLDENGELIVTQMTSGITQGDELSMLFFGLYTGTILKELDGEEADGFFAKRSSKYADDICQAATFDLNAKKFEQLRQRLEQDGMKFSLAKCCL